MFLGPHLYWSVIFLLVWVFFWDRTYIDLSFILSVEFKLRSYPYRSIIFRVSLRFWGRTYIDRPSSYQFVFSLSYDHTYIDRSSFLSVLSFRGSTYIDRPSSCQLEFEFSGPHLYRSVIFRVSLIFRGLTYVDWSFFVLVWVRTTPISTSHFSCQFEFEFFGTTPISSSHLLCQFEFSGPHLYRSVIFHVSLSLSFSRPHLYRSVIFMSVCVQFELEPHLYQSVIFHVSTRLSFSRLHLYRSIIHLVN